MVIKVLIFTFWKCNINFRALWAHILFLFPNGYPLLLPSLTVIQMTCFSPWNDFPFPILRHQCITTSRDLTQAESHSNHHSVHWACNKNMQTRLCMLSVCKRFNKELWEAERDKSFVLPSQPFYPLSISKSTWALSQCNSCDFTFSTYVLTEVAKDSTHHHPSQGVVWAEWVPCLSAGTAQWWASAGVNWTEVNWFSGIRD